MRRVILLVLMLAVPAAAHAQWRAVPQAGYLKYDDGSAMSGMPVGGIEFVRDLGALFAVGLSFDYARGEVDGERFPPAELHFGVDSTIFAVIHQPISVMNYGLRVEVGPRTGTFQPYAAGGVGAYTLFLNPQQWDSPRTLSGTQLALGGGLRVRASDRFALALDARDLIYPDFDPNDLNVVSEENRNDLFPELNPPPIEAGAMHNIRVTIGFQFSPTGGR